MVDNPNADYYRSGQGSLTGFDSANLPQGNPNLAVTGWSIEELRRFLLNQSDVNFPSNEWILRVEAMIRDHETDYNNPHRTTLDQIVGDFVRQVLGNIAPGTIPDISPFYSFDAQLALPLSTIVPATHTTSNLYRQTAGGWLQNPSLEADLVGTDYISSRPGIPLFSNLTNVTPANWATAPGTTYNTAIADSTDTTLRYPFTFKDVTESPVSAQFGINLPMTQDLQANYTSSFFIKPSVNKGTLRIYQPSDSSNYVDLDVETGAVTVFSDVMAATAVRYVNGVIRVSVNFTSLTPVPDNRLRIIHINEGSNGDGTRQGSLGRPLFSIGSPQTTKGALNQPVIIDLAQPAATSTLSLDFTKVGAPATMDTMIITISLDLYPALPLVPILDPNILSMGPLVISRDQETIRVSVNGSPIFTSEILEGLNVITLSYSPTKLIFKDLAEERKTQTGTFPALPTNIADMGPFGGYLHYVAFYAQEDKNQVVEYLNNG